MSSILILKVILNCKTFLRKFKPLIFCTIFLINSMSGFKTKLLKHNKKFFASTFWPRTLMLPSRCAGTPFPEYEAQADHCMQAWKFDFY